MRKKIFGKKCWGCGDEIYDRIQGWEMLHLMLTPSLSIRCCVHYWQENLRGANRKNINSEIKASKFVGQLVVSTFWQLELPCDKPHPHTYLHPIPQSQRKGFSLRAHAGPCGTYKVSIRKIPRGSREPQPLCSPQIGVNQSKRKYCTGYPNILISQVSWLKLGFLAHTSLDDTEDT